MTKGLLFWILYVVWVIFGVGIVIDAYDGVHFFRHSVPLILIILVGLLGWGIYGPPIKG